MIVTCRKGEYSQFQYGLRYNTNAYRYVDLPPSWHIALLQDAKMNNVKDRMV